MSDKSLITLFTKYKKDEMSLEYVSIVLNECLKILPKDADLLYMKRSMGYRAPELGTEMWNQLGYLATQKNNEAVKSIMSIAYEVAYGK